MIVYTEHVAHQLQPCSGVTPTSHEFFFMVMVYPMHIMPIHCQYVHTHCSLCQSGVLLQLYV